LLGGVLGMLAYWALAPGLLFLCAGTLRWTMAWV
jgi:hypothetical protein